MRRNLTKQERLGKKSDIKRTFASGKRYSIPGAKLVFLTNDLDYSRFMVTLIKNYGNSVERNRVKRIAREIYRLNKHRLKPGFDIVVVFFPDRDEYSVREKQMLTLFKKAGLYSSGGPCNNYEKAG